MDLLMISITNSVCDVLVEPNSFEKVNSSFAQFVIGFLSMVLVFDAWFDHASQTSPSLGREREGN